jgi:spermidine synthase
MSGQKWTVPPAPQRRYLPLFLLLFAASGCAALIYEIAWFQMLQLVVGSSAVSLGLLLGTFMGGMCLGSIALPRLVKRRAHPLMVYGLLELSLGILGVLVLWGMPLVERVYAESAGHGFGAMLFRGGVFAACLLAPTVLMGGTLPAIARWIGATPQGVSWLGLFYGGNIAGAVFGCLLAGFYLLRVHDLPVATYVAAGINVGVALISLTAAYRMRGYRPPSEKEEPAVDAARGSWAVYVAIALSGATALAAEVVWTRLLSLMLGATVYTFSIILAVFLVGLGVGSSLGSLAGRVSRRPALMLGICQLLLAAAIGWTAWILSRSLPYWPINPSLSRSPWLNFQLDLVRCLWALLPATCLWGASFPLALAAAADDQDPGRLVGGVYAANTIGGIVGALVSSLLLIRWLGTQQTQRVLIGLAGMAAVVVLLSHFWAAAKDNSSALRRWWLAPIAGLGLLILMATPAALLAWSVPAVPWELIAFGRFLPTHEDDWKMLYVGEGINASIAVTEVPTGARNFHVSGKVEASSDGRDMRLQRMLGHLPALLHSAPRSVLIVGFGAGVTSGSFVVHPEVQQISICEIEPLIPHAVAPFFAKENHEVLRDPRVEIIHDDARHYVLSSPRRFDIITSDPIHPWVKGSAALYTREYFELCKRHLNPGGFISQWVPLYESNVNVVKSEIATFFQVFPNGTIWSNDDNGQGYDIVLLGQAEALAVDADEIQARLDQADYARVKKSLEEVGFRTSVGLLRSYAGRASDLAPWLVDAQINRDRNLRLQYLAGLELNTNQSDAIHEAMMDYVRLPENLLVGTGMRSVALRVAIRRSIRAHQQGERYY